MKRDLQQNLRCYGKIVRGSADKSKRTVVMALSSEKPVRRDGYIEVLDHSPSSIDLSRLKNAHPLLLAHNHNEQIGVIEDAWLEGKRCRCRARFGDGELATEIWKDVESGIRQHVSVGYDVTRQLSSERDPDTGDPVIRFAWLPYEVSIVPIPADDTVGIGRNARQTDADGDYDGDGDDDDKFTYPVSCRYCGHSFSAAISQSCPLCKTFYGEPVKKKNYKCNYCGRDFNADAEAVCPGCGTYINEEMPRSGMPPIDEDLQNEQIISEQQGAKYYIEEISFKMKDQTKAKPNLLGMSRKEIQQFSITNALRRRFENQNPLNWDKPDGLEGEVLEAARAKFKNNMPEGNLFIPPDVLLGDVREPLVEFKHRDLNAGTAAQGGNFTPSLVLPMIELLRNKTVVLRAGGQLLAGLDGAISVPRQTGAATAYTLAEQQAITKSTQALNQTPMFPHRISAATSYSKQLVLQSSEDVELFVRKDMMGVLGVKMDGLALYGTGGTDPLGIRNVSGIGAVTFGGAATWDKVLEFESDVATALADIGSLAYITTPTVRRKWKNVVKISGQASGTLWELLNFRFPDADGCVNDTAAYSTTQLNGNEVAYGNFEDAIIGMWGGVDITIDPFTSMGQGTINLTMNVFVDNLVRHVGSFAWSSDAANQ